MYRCTYGDDAAWQTFLECINAWIQDSLEYHHGLDLLEEDCFKLTALEDASKSDGVSVQLVREHSKKNGGSMRFAKTKVQSKKLRHDASNQSRCMIQDVR